MFNPNNLNGLDIGKEVDQNKKRIIAQQAMNVVENNEIMKIWSDFANFTTSHGIPHIDHARGRIRKVLWTVLTLICLGMLVVNMKELCNKYLDFEVDMKFSVQHNLPLLFPAVTICNNNPMKKSKIPEIKDLNESIINYHKKIEALKCSVNDSYLSKPPPSSNNTKCIPTSGNNKNEKIDFKMRNLAGEIYYEMRNSAQFYHIGHTIDDLIVDCQFSGKYCFGEFTHMYSARYGNCFTFNSAEDGKYLKTINNSGPNNGLLITFNVEQDEYIGEITQYAGLRVVVHHPRNMPFPDDEGILLAPNALTHIGIQLV
ncbi:hypothetical protein HELRODRAFT_168355 [Helobdella robusta]|uniref:Uncharacterized protein n=1 Tax=Helobdella robusta TaxID=6412 RepID=T1F0G4_HELRO|nr:hypothetical protein HELRODRAFT_168355 [Helobdella robusta]ESO09374.1 hypothetical protein HELRODRAFT_168355 [Helobdella robusta]